MIPFSTVILVVLAGLRILTNNIMVITMLDVDLETGLKWRIAVLDTVLSKHEKIVGVCRMYRIIISNENLQT